MNNDEKFIVTYVSWVSSLFNIFKDLTLSLILLILALIVLYTGIAMTQEDVRAGKNKVALKIS